MKLTDTFLSYAEEDWRTAVAGSAPSGRLDARSDDGIPVGPIYSRRADVAQIAGSGAGRPWRIVQRVSCREMEPLLAACEEEFSGGADGVELVFDTSIHPLTGTTPVGLGERLAAPILAMMPQGGNLRVDAGAATAPVAEAFLAPALSGSVRLDLCFDPIAAAAAGRLSLSDVHSAIVLLSNVRGTGALFFADGRIWHAGGASEVQELTAVLATLVEYIRLLDERDVPPSDVAARAHLALAADTDQFQTIAKVRAMRLLVARALELLGIAAAIPIHAETAWRMMSRREPRMNTLRTTGAAFAAAAGGADSISVLPHDILDGDSTPAARRLARNTQSILAHESQLYRFADPGAGSGAVEALTDALAEAAWDRFRRIEAEGGILAVLDSGSLQQEIAASRGARLARVAAGEIEIIGANAFVESKTPLEAPSLPPPARVGRTEALTFKRLAEQAEAVQ